MKSANYKQTKKKQSTKITLIKFKIIEKEMER